VFQLQQTAITEQQPELPPSQPIGGAALQVKDRTLLRPRRYEPGRGRLLTALGGVSIAISVACMVVGALLPGTPLLLAPWAIGIGIPVWVMGQRDMEKIRLAALDPYAENLTRLGWASGIVGTLLGVLMMMCGACGGVYLLIRVPH
jgi:hypothetical protein